MKNIRRDHLSKFGAKYKSRFNEILEKREREYLKEITAKSRRPMEKWLPHDINLYMPKIIQPLHFRKSPRRMKTAKKSSIVWRKPWCGK